MAYDSNPGANRLADVLSGRMKKESVQETVIDFGSIEDKRYLRTDRLQEPIGPKEYEIARHIRNLKKGDRVIVAWIGSETVIIAKI